MARSTHSNPRQSVEFDAEVSNMAAAIWNGLIEKPAFCGLKIPDFADIFEAVASALYVYHAKNPSIHLRT